MFWLVLYYTSVVVIPEKYPNLEQCQAAGASFVASKQFSCIPAVSSAHYCTQVIPNTSYGISVPCDGYGAK